MEKTIGILAHVDAGKTTFCEQLLYHTNSIRSRGRVDYKNSFLDNNTIEKERGITIFSEIGILNYNHSNYYLIDTPGHVDFSTEMERSIKIIDYAILIISAVEGIQSHTEAVWNLLRKNNIPTFIFINKIDRIGADVETVLNELKKKFSNKFFLVKDNLNHGDMSEELIEFTAENDYELLEQYLYGSYDKNIWIKSFSKLIKNEIIFPCFSGSALQDIGILDFFEAFHKLTFTEYNKNNNDKFLARVYKIKYDNNGNRITYIKVLKGGLKVKEEVFYYNNEEKVIEKVNEIRLYNGNKFKFIEEANEGMVLAVAGLSQAKAGMILGDLDEKNNFQFIPTIKSKVIFNKNLNCREVLNLFRMLEAEDPMLNVQWIEESKEIEINIMGLIQLEILKDIVKERFNLDINFGPSEIIYKETINEEAYGCAHFEPLKHYSEVHFKLEPGKKNSGIVFESICHVDDLSIAYQNLIKSHVFEREHRGILTGSSLTDLKITLIIGRSHNKHTSGGDFREVTFRALRQGIEKVKNILLEPYYNFKIEVQMVHMGRVLSDIQKLNGRFKDPEISDDMAYITGYGPVSTFMNYGIEIASFTQGKGKINLIFAGYDSCHNTEDVIKKRAYNKDEDREYTSNSIFCSKGKAYMIEGNKADEFMHCFNK